MHRKDLNERSPVRLLEHSIHGGLGRGKLGVVVARHGVGKTAFLVGVALDDLMRGRKVLHVSLDTSIEKVAAFYDEVFMDLSHAQALEDVWKVRLEAERNRRIYTFEPERFNADKLRTTLGFLREHGDFVPGAIIVDGLDFDRISRVELDGFRSVAQEISAEMWMSAVTHRDRDRNARGIPEPVAQLEAAIDVILQMAHDGKAVRVGLLKDHDNPEVSELRLALDPTTLLLIRE